MTVPYSAIFPHHQSVWWHVPFPRVFMHAMGLYSTLYCTVRYVYNTVCTLYSIQYNIL